MSQFAFVTHKSLLIIHPFNRAIERKVEKRNELEESQVHNLSTKDIQEIFGDNQQQSVQKTKICYARVSSEHQRDDLERQIEYEIVSDISSGLNWKRRGFVALLEQIHVGGIEEVVVTQKIRACGMDL
ncbi:9016_t:CDS:2 [Funneliformis geosporum]|nr:9016_t:CDS:2 [Funneliformis geosporum]